KVKIKLKHEKKLDDITTKIKEREAPDNIIVIWMDLQDGDSYQEEATKEDPKFVSAPSVKETLNTTNVMIEGDFTVESATYLADIINSGSLPVHMTELYSTSVGAQF